jgi:hypothetical protein
MDGARVRSSLVIKHQSNILQTEQVSQLCALVEAQLDFHRRTTQILEGLKEQLKTR